ncbi:HD domain-containing phosphohydrolase [Deinococcus pimensis]|uniref:HD domain-containing phosphohydrolase n=1 Tax=Deinococcus pimensis TaxID=309888 RepID=UPI0004AD1AC3|nr:HD domain-containing phosphohydrolase [Deinococcus pimensis]
MTTAAPLQGDTLLLSITRRLLSLSSPADLCHEGLRFLAHELRADLAMLHVQREGDVFTLAASVGEHPKLTLHEVQLLTPRWRELLLAGEWHSQPLPNDSWEGPEELGYVHLGARHLVCFGLHSGERLVGYVGLLFRDPRPELGTLGVLGTLGALWGTLLDRLSAQAALNAREAMLRSVTDNGTDLVTVLDAGGVITYQSASSVRMVGFTVNEMLSRDVFGFIHEDDRAHVSEIFAALVAEPGATRDVTFRFAHRAGHHVWVECRGRNLLADPDVRGVVVHTRDVTEQQRTRARLEQRVQDLSLMHAASQALARATDVESVVNDVVKLIRARLRQEYVRVLRVDEEGVTTVVNAEEDDLPGALHPSSAVRLLPGQGLVGACVASGETVLVNDVLADERYVPLYAQVRSELVVPLWVGGRVWGALNVESTTPGAFGDEDRRALETVAAQIGAGLATVLLLDELRRSHHDLEGAYDETIEGWARALDFRDQETEGHSQRVTELTVRLARRMGLGEETLVHVRRGALLHDIGKMGIPDHVLRKPGPLTGEEWGVMRRHPGMAMELLSPIRFLAPALEIPYAHHEKWDGSGYPRGLRGEEIPLAARIFAVVDVWDALRSDRPYRPAWSAERARAHIEAGAGSHFDREVVRVFLSVLAGGDGT